MMDPELRFVKRKDGAGYDVGGMGDCEGPDIVIPAEHDGERVVGIAEGAFCGCRTIRSVTIEDGVEEIGKKAFMSSSLRDVTIPSSVRKIGSQAFEGCVLDAVRLDDLAAWCAVDMDGKSGNPLAFAKTLFVGGMETYDIVIPEGVEEISYNAFNGYRNLLSVTLPRSLTRIGSSAFKDCRGLIGVCNLSSIELHLRSKGEGHVAEYVNDVCDANGIAMTIPRRRTVRDGYVFCDVGDELFLAGYLGDEDELVLPVTGDTPYEIKPYAFAETGVRSVVIPSGVTAIGCDAFYQCDSLRRVVIGDDVRRIGEYSFDDCRSLTDVRFGAAVESIGEHAFCGCFRLKEICLPDGLRTVGKEAFYKCFNFRRVVIPWDIRFIDRKAFMTQLGPNIAFYCYCDERTWDRVTEDESWSDEYGRGNARFFRNREEAVMAMRRDSGFDRDYFGDDPDDDDPYGDDPDGDGTEGRGFDE